MALGPSLQLAAAAAAATFAPAPAAAEPVVVILEVNGTARAEAVVVYRGPDGFHVPAAVLAELGVALDGLGQTEIEGVDQLRIGDIAGAEAALDAVTQRLRLTLPATAFRAQTVSYGAEMPGPMTPSGRGIFFNYDLILSAAGEGAGLGGGLEVGYFSGSSFASSTSLVRWDREGTRFVRLDTSWRRDDPDGLTTLRVGDSISRGGAGTAPVRFGGVQYGRSFGLRPGFVTMPVPSIGGEATVPSVVDLYVNGILAGSRAVQPGPFQADDVPVVSGDGTVSAVVRDAAGRETVVSQNYYASPALLRPGMSDFSYEIGFLRQGYGVRSASYGAPFVSATHRRGLSDRLTIEGHAAASLDVQQAGAAADLALPRIGLIGGTIAASRSDRGVGGSAEIRFEHRGQVSLTGSAAFTSADFAQVGEARERRSASTTVQMFAGAPLRFGSLGIAYFLRDEAGSAWDVEHLGLRGSFPLGRLGTLYLSGRRSFGQDRELAIEARLSVRLGRETSASAELRRRDGLGEAYALVQRPVPFGEGFGYRAHAGFGSNGPGFGAWLGLNGPAGEYGAELTLRNGDVAGRVSAAGAIGLLDGDLFVSRPLNQSFAVVTVGGQENVRVYADNHLVARTGRNGRAIVPRLRAYERNLIRLEYADLPLDAEVAQGARAIRPYARGGVSVRFSARRRRGGMVRIEIEGGDPLPAGSRVRLGGREFLVAHGGQVYLEGLEPANELEISWAAGTCSLRLIVPDGPDPQPDLGIRRCTPRPD